MSESVTTVTRPGGRSARVRAAVLRAVGDLVATVPGDALTIPQIAAAAGVHPTTVYRRWGSVGDLLADAAANRFAGDLVVPDTGSLRGDLERWAADVATDLQDDDVVRLMRAAAGSGAAGCQACVDDRRHQIAAMIDRERSRGGAVPPAEDVAERLLGPLYYRAFFLGAPGSRGWASALVPSVLVAEAVQEAAEDTAGAR